MLLLRTLLLWSIISLHVVGGAVLFRRWFPRESPWFGFLVPGVALVVLLNFIEHLVALPSLLWLLPYSALGCLWALTQARESWKDLRLPAGIFLASFAFTLTLRCLRPDISGVRDGTVDLSLLASFCQGEKLPPTLVWYPPLHLSQYYMFGQYAMSVVTRLLGLDIGTGFNLSSALLAAFDCFLAAAAAWRIGRQRLWLTLLAPVLMEGAATGASAFLWFISKDYDPSRAVNIQTAMDDPAVYHVLGGLIRQGWWYDRSELMAPGCWSWLGSFHSTCGGQFLTLFLVFSTLEVVRRRSSNWPWICAGSIPVLCIVTSTYAFPLAALLVLGTLFWAWRYRLTPRNLRFVVMTLGGFLILLTPLLLEFLTTSATPHGAWTVLEDRTQLFEFLILWWPVFVPWLALFFVWPKLGSALKTVMIALPIVLIGMEIYIMGGRPDWTSKLWGYCYGAGWITLIPEVCRRRAWAFRALAGVVVLSSLISFLAWSVFTWRAAGGAPPDSVFHLEGTGELRQNPLFGNILQVLSSLKGQTVITGKSDGMYCQSPLLADFAGNRVYVTWNYFCDINAGGQTYGQAARRTDEVNDLLAGTCPDPLLFLRSRNIAALVIYPGDHIPDEVVAQLKARLAPSYSYSDFRSFDPDQKINSGIFVYQPQMTGWPSGTPNPAPVR